MRQVVSLALVVFCSGAACSGPATPPPSPPPPPPPATPVELSVTLDPLRWLVGDWVYEDGGASEHWVGVAGVLYGIAFVEDDDFDVMVIDDADGADDGPAPGEVRLISMPGGIRAVSFPMTAHGEREVTFANPGNDFPRRIHYQRPTDGTLVAELSGAAGDAPLAFAMRTDAGVVATDAEAEDHRLAADLAAQGVAGWLAHVEDDEPGLMLVDGRLEGKDEIGRVMGEWLGARALRREPVWSRLGPSGEVAATVGRYHLELGGEPTGGGSYAALWRRDADGTWRVAFEVDRPENRTE
ncbi:MAG: hypothetical protein KC464_35975 [Myxococcales bacterium]|nr:hypothetical protein [Myxococcales bacterium]